ncbi:AraC-type DNA-binding protein [Filimonas lacunae]|uniref:AraC-type DNA-binding protein n=1 Tax=Filimonas lacunae TaxID=477680 RepID=A0A173MMQ2_9BACT|nr:AraC family transcriptional regulator [Filimonas lacunae]BAV08658.1 transcriptional regulator, AraC family [Filimonas lacunae]SIS59427.1 AraC-type DNA-binding protein [Filimonas lacunae]
MEQLRQFEIKKLGYTDIDSNNIEEGKLASYHDFIKIIFLKAGGSIQVDFKAYHLEQDALFFVQGGQWYQFDEALCNGAMLFYNKDFYCVEMHDAEVACDGILFHNIYEIPVVYLDAAQSALMQGIFTEIKTEMQQEESGMEEMLRILLKQIIIRSTRLWKQAHQVASLENRQEVEFARRFSQLVEAHYITRHSVADYAALLNMTPKALQKRIAKYSKDTPNDIIKDRIILEAKRLLAHTELSVKEVGYKLGYDDPAYFIRLFTNHVEVSPQHFRKSYQSSGV